MIEIEGVTKIFRVEGNTKTVLNKVSLTLPPDKSVALIGRNGAGKSSLLKIISGLSKPNEGFVRTSCRISWPIGFAGSFHNDLSGAQNARFVARVYGVPSDRVVEYVSEFSELGEELYNPVRTYSSGMRARLAFAVSMAVDFDYYLIDEVTSVGDAAFRKKCADTLLQKIGKCGALVVSHNPGMLKKLCTSAVVIENSKAYYFDKVQPAISFYNWCRDSSNKPDEIGDITSILEHIDDVDPQSNIHEVRREYKRNSSILSGFFANTKRKGTVAEREYRDRIEHHLKLYASSSDVSGRHSEVLSQLAVDRTTWARIFPATQTEVALGTLDKFVANEQWEEAESLSFFLFSEQIDGAAVVLESLCRTYMNIRSEEKLRSGDANSPKRAKAEKGQPDQKRKNTVQASPTAAGRWLTLARAAVRAHDAGTNAHILLAEALLSAPKPLLEEAQPHVDLVLERRPYSAAAHLTLAQAFFYQNRLADATSAVERTLELDPNLVEAQNFLERVEEKRTALANHQIGEEIPEDDEVLELDDEFDEEEFDRRRRR